MAIDRETTAFTKAVAAEVRAYMARADVNQTEVANRLGRSQGYVSERINAIRAFDMDDIDGIADLMGLTGVEFLARVARQLKAEAPVARDELSDRRGRIAASPSEARPHAAYDSNDGIPESATEDDFTI